VINECNEAELGPIESIIEQASGVDLQFLDSDEPISADRRQKQITLYAFTQSVRNETEVELVVNSLGNKRHLNTSANDGKYSFRCNLSFYSLGLMAGVLP
jgi:hypothetical protein